MFHTYKFGRELLSSAQFLFHRLKVNVFVDLGQPVNFVCC